MQPNEAPPEPWLSFFNELDEALEEPVDLHCFGGFALIYAYRVARTTNDCDFLVVIGSQWLMRIRDLGGMGSALHKRHRVYLDPVTVAEPPDSYEERITPFFPGLWKHISLYVLEVHDLALAKLTRNIDRDMQDVQLLARAGRLDPKILLDRYQAELRPNLPGRHGWHDGALKMWIEENWPEFDCSVLAS
jgi:hypothetical protein